MMALGAAGTMNAVGNLAPALVADACRQVLEGRLEDARRLHYHLLEVNRAVFWETNPIPIKYLMRRMGLLRTNEHRLPMKAAEPALERRLDDLMTRHAWLLDGAEPHVPAPIADQGVARREAGR
jgi:4-hydroxy-tetrahydrodipicolinate synthase